MYHCRCDKHRSAVCGTVEQWIHSGMGRSTMAQFF